MYTYTLINKNTMEKHTFNTSKECAEFAKAHMTTIERCAKNNRPFMSAITHQSFWVLRTETKKYRNKKDGVKKRPIHRIMAFDENGEVTYFLTKTEACTYFNISRNKMNALIENGNEFNGWTFDLAD